MQHTHTRAASLQWNYRLVILPLFWVNTFTGYLGNAVNEPSLERLALLAAMDTLFSIRLFLALMLVLFVFHLHLLSPYQNFPQKISLSLRFWSFYLFTTRTRFMNFEWITFNWNIWYNEIAWKDNHPCGGNVNIAAAKEYTVEYKWDL